MADSDSFSKYSPSITIMIIYVKSYIMFFSICIRRFVRIGRTAQQAVLMALRRWAGSPSRFAVGDGQRPLCARHGRGIGGESPLDTLTEGSPHQGDKGAVRRGGAGRAGR